MRVLLLIVALSVLPAWGFAAGDLDTSVDAYIHGEMISQRIPALALAVIQHGRIVKMSAYGHANVEFSVPATVRTIFQVASITKEFTSVGVMTLVEAGQVKLDDHIGIYLSNLPDNWRDITIRQLLGHTSGLPDVIDGASEPLADTPEEALRLLSAKPMDFVPGSKWAYNQTNYLLLSLMIEKVSGEPFEMFCKMRLFAPLNLTTPSFGLQRVIEHRASLYTDIVPNSGPSPKHLDHLELSTGKMVPMLYSAGGLNISIEDFAHWLIAVLDGKIISRASLETLWTPAPLNDGSRFENYGLGWWLVPQGPHPEAGGNGGARAAFAVYQKDDLAVVVLTNLQGSEATSLVEGVAKKYLQGSLKKPLHNWRRRRS